jgi:hypothetical protein
VVVHGHLSVVRRQWSGVPSAFLVDHAPPSARRFTGSESDSQVLMIPEVWPQTTIDKMDNLE